MYDRVQEMVATRSLEQPFRVLPKVQIKRGTSGTKSTAI